MDSSGLNMASFHHGFGNENLASDCFPKEWSRSLEKWYGMGVCLAWYTAKCLCNPVRISQRLGGKQVTTHITGIKLDCGGFPGFR